MFSAILVTFYPSLRQIFGSCSLIPFEISVPEGSTPVTSRPHRINHILAKEFDATLNQYLAACLIQGSTFPCSSPLMVIPKKFGGVQTTVNYKKLNQMSSLSQLPIPRLDRVLDSLGKGRLFFPVRHGFFVLSDYRAQEYRCSHGVLHSPTGLYERRVMPHGSSAPPRWFAKVTNEVIKELERVEAYLDDVIALDSDPTADVKTMRALFERLRKHNLKLSPSKARLGATDADFLGHPISPAGMRPNAAKKSAFIKLPMPRDLNQMRPCWAVWGTITKTPA